MRPKDKRTLRYELTNLQARFGLLTELNKRMMIVLEEMRLALPLQRAKIVALTEENMRLKEALSLIPTKPETIDEIDALFAPPSKQESKCDSGTCDFASDNNGGAKCVNCGATVPF